MEWFLQTSPRFLGIRFAAELLPYFSLIVPVVEHSECAKRLFGNLWLALGQAG
jgi:hypothetical protein